MIGTDFRNSVALDSLPLSIIHQYLSGLNGGEKCNDEKIRSRKIRFIGLLPYQARPLKISSNFFVSSVYQAFICQKQGRFRKRTGWELINSAFTRRGQKHFWKNLSIVIFFWLLGQLSLTCDWHFSSHSVHLIDLRLGRRVERDCEVLLHLRLFGTADRPPGLWRAGQAFGLRGQGTARCRCGRHTIGGAHGDGEKFGRVSVDERVVRAVRDAVSRHRGEWWGRKVTWWWRMITWRWYGACGVFGPGIPGRS